MRYINLRFTYLLTYTSKVHCCLYYNGGLEDQSPTNNMGNGVNSFLKYLKRQRCNGSNREGQIHGKWGYRPHSSEYISR